LYHGSQSISIILEEYLEDSLDLIDEIEQVLLTIEKEGRGDHLWDCLMRTLHSFKGSAQLMGLDSIVAVTHAMESLVSQHRHNVTADDITPITLCYECIDALRSLEKELSLSGNCTQDISSLLHKISESIM
jgi:two-component system chemotaxis sensor kinase CheA